jgi:hypothetical protein
MQSQPNELNLDRNAAWSPQHHPDTSVHSVFLKSLEELAMKYELQLKLVDDNWYVN